MKLHSIFLCLVTLTLVAASAFADSGRPERFPGGRGGPNPGMGPIKPDPRPGQPGYGQQPPRRDDGWGNRGDGRRDDRRDDHWGDRREDRRNDHWNDHRGGGYYPPQRPEPPYRPYPPQRPQPPYYPPNNPPPPVYNPPPSYNDRDSVMFNSVTRSAGGEWLRVNFNYPAYIRYFEVQVQCAAAQVHEAYVTTESGARYSVRSLFETGTFTSSRASEILNINERIVAIDVRAESMGGNADILVSVTSAQGDLSLSGNRY